MWFYKCKVQKILPSLFHELILKKILDLVGRTISPFGDEECLAKEICSTQLPSITTWTSKHVFFCDNRFWRECCCWIQLERFKKKIELLFDLWKPFLRNRNVIITFLWTWKNYFIRVSLFWNNIGQHCELQKLSIRTMCSAE